MRNFILAILLTCLPLVAQAQVMPLTGQRFALPLEDGTTTQAVMLDAPQDCLHLVYATRTGQLVFLHITKTAPDPDPVPPPPPPPAKSISVAIVHDPAMSTPLQRQVMADRMLREAIQPPHSFMGNLPFDLVNPNTGKTPENLAPFLNAAKGKKLPCLIFLDENNNVILNEPLPDTTQSVLDLFRKHGGLTDDTVNHRRQQRTRSKRGTTRPPHLYSRRQTRRLLSTSI